MGEQVSLFDVGNGQPLIPTRRLLAKRHQRHVGPVVVQLTMDERADETRWLAEWYDDLELGFCPIPKEPDGSPRRCPLRKCSEHLMVPRNGDEQKTPEELDWDWAWMPYHCIRDFVADYPNGAPLEDIGMAMRTSRQTVQDDLEAAMDNPAWCALEG